MAFTDAQKLGLGTGAAGIGAGLMGMFGGGHNPADASMGYLNQIPGAVSPYYNPYIQAGSQALPQLQGQYGNLVNNPGGTLNQIGSQFQQSPGFKFALEQALGAGNRAAAAGGMAGSPAHEQQNMQLASDLGNQDYYHWLQGATGMYGQGLQGMGGLANMGLQAGTSLSDQIAQALSSKAQLGYAGQAAQNQSEGSGWGNLFGGIGSVLSAFL